MGASPYWYTVKYQSNIQKALDELREREFQAGRYNPVIDFPEFPVTPSSPSPGAQHDSIEEAFEEADADGTRSILDINTVGEEPDFCTASPLSEDSLMEFFGTIHPTKAMVEQSDWWENIERGQAVYVILYKNDQPDEIFFVGYSFD